MINLQLTGIKFKVGKEIFTPHMFSEKVILAMHKEILIKISKNLFDGKEIDLKDFCDFNSNFCIDSKCDGDTAYSLNVKREHGFCHFTYEEMSMYTKETILECTITFGSDARFEPENLEFEVIEF